MVRRVDAAAGIAIDVPGAAEIGVLFDDLIGNAEPAERRTKRDGRDAGADDQHLRVVEPRRPCPPGHVAARSTMPISSRIIGAYSAGTASPRQALIMR